MFMIMCVVQFDDNTLAADQQSDGYVSVTRDRVIFTDTKI